MKNFEPADFLYLGESPSVSKAAVLLSVTADEKDSEIVDYLGKLGIKSVITRAGGRGDNLKDKLFRNSLTAAENSGVIGEDRNFKYAFFNLFSRLLRKLEMSLFSISGAGFKIGIARKDNFFSVAVSGKMGIPGMNIDYDIIEVETDYISLPEE